MSFLSKFFAKKDTQEKPEQNREAKTAPINTISKGSGRATRLFTASYYNNLKHVTLFLAQGEDPNDRSFINASNETLSDPNMPKAAVRLIKEGQAKKAACPSVYHHADLGITNLYYPASEGYSNVAHALLEAGANPDARILTGLFPLYVAAKSGYLDIVQDLIEHGANVDQTTPDGATALIGAAEEGWGHVAEYLLAQGASVATKDNEGRNASEAAVHCGYPEIADVISHFCNPSNTRDNQKKPGSLQQLLEKAGLPIYSDINYSDFSNSITEAFADGILSGAIHPNDTQLAAYAEARKENRSPKQPLLQCFGENETFDNFLLQIAKSYLLTSGVCRKNVKQVKEALVAGADPNFPIECRYMNTSTVPIVEAATAESFEAVEALIEHGANPNRSKVNGESALALAANRGNAKITQYLLEHGADPNITRWFGTPLAFADNYEVTKLLLEYGADPNIPDRDDDLPIIAAIDQNRPDAVQLLIDYGTNLNHKNKLGIDAFTHARIRQNNASAVVLRASRN